MSHITAKETLGPQCPAGTHIAICFRIVDIGTQPDTGFGEKRKLVINWELPHERVTYDGKDMPMALSRIYALTLGKRSNLRKDLVAWRGRDFTAEELDGFELRNVLGKACQVTVTLNEDGRAGVTGVVGMPKGMQAPACVNPLVEYSIDDGKNDTYKALPEWLRKMCDKCLEWTGATAVDAPPTTEEPEPTGGDPDVPFN